MVIGKTSSSISLSEILNQFSETEILSSVFPEITALPCVICSPLRVDRHPSFSIYLSDNGHIHYKDYATQDSGGLLDLLCSYWGCTFPQCLDKLSNMLITNKDVTIKGRQLKTFTRKEKNLLTKIQVVVRPWHDYDYEYWENYGIGKKWLRHAEVYPISHKIVIKKENPQDKGKRYIFPADKYAYVFVERKEGDLQMKIYQPMNKKGFKWCSSMDASVISLWTKVPEYGDRIVICSSLKDALCLSSQLHIPAIAPQGEGYSMSNKAISELKRRYKKVFICFDTDKAGKIDSKKLAENTGFINVIPDLGKEKDISDYYKSLSDKTQFKQLEKLFN